LSRPDVTITPVFTASAGPSIDEDHHSEEDIEISPHAFYDDPPPKSIIDKIIDACDIIRVDPTADCYLVEPIRDAMSAAMGFSDDFETAEFWLGGTDIANRIANFYLLLDLSLDHEEVIPLYERHREELARHLLNYITVACLGEARLAFHGVIIESREALRSPLAASLVCVLATEAETGFLSGWDGLLEDRYTMWSVGYKLLRGRVSHLDILTGTHEMFLQLDWGPANACGGRAWANIASVGIQYLTQEITPLLFIDMLVDIQHNGGWAFNKYYARDHICKRHETSLGAILDIKAGATWKLTNVCCIDPDVMDLFQRFK
jgi:hypothetical protein